MEMIPREMIRAEKIVVDADRIRAQIRLDEEAPRRTNPALAARVIAAFPDLLSHSCKNSAGTRFGDVIERTPLPHLLEHLVISLQVQNPQTPVSFVFVGCTQWMSEKDGLALVEVNFADDLVALKAFRDGLQFLNEIMVS